MRGYSQSIVEANHVATPSVGVALGAVCISLKYPLAKVAKELGVSRQAVYDWFSGKTKPARDKELLINELIQRLTIEY
jgi:transcriptional regulator with XRE-family HTH domain